MDQKFKDALQPFAENYHSMAKAIEELSDDGLKTLCEALNKPTTTNCWYATKGAADLLRPLVSDEYGRRTMLQMRALDEASKHLT